MSYDFEALKRIPIESVLAHYGVEVRKRNDTVLVCKCPLPSHRETEHKNDRNETFCIGLLNNKWICHSTNCQRAGNHRGGDVVDLVKRLDNSDTKTAAKKLSSLFVIPAAGSAGVIHKPAPTNKPVAFALRGIEFGHPSIIERGITFETAMRFGVGYFGGKGSMINRIVFPLHEHGKLIGYAGRSVNGEEPKWKLPAGLVRSFIFGLDRCDPKEGLILVESCWAVLWFHQFGKQAAALIGTCLTDAQEKLLEPYRYITIAMDNDAAGREAAEKIAVRLRPRHTIHKAFLIE